MADWIIKQEPTLCCLQETYVRAKTHTDSKGWKKTLYANGNDKKAGAAKLLSDRNDFKTKAVTKDKGHYI